MQGIKHGDERWPFDHGSMRYLADEGCWAFNCQACDFVVRGGPEGPEIARLGVAGFVAARIDEFVRECNSYLAAFVVPERFEARGPWEMHSIEFGRNPADPLDVFEVLLVLEGDTYGRWGVRFRLNSDRFYPVQFSRQQW